MFLRASPHSRLGAFLEVSGYAFIWLSELLTASSRRMRMFACQTFIANHHGIPLYYVF